MNTATVRDRRSPKSSPLSASPAITSMPRDAQKKIFFFSDELRARWEQIVSKGHS